MKEKYYEFTTTFAMGIIFLFVGMILAIGKDELYQSIISTIIFLLWGNAFVQLVRLYFRHQSKEKKKKALISCLFHLVLCLFFALLPDFILGLAPILFAFYLTILGISQYIMGYLEIKTKENFGVRYFLLGCIYLAIAIPIILSPLGKLDNFLICLVIYAIFLGLSFIWDALIQIIPINTKNRFKRKIKITLPKIIEAIIPYRVMVDINRNLEVKEQNYSYHNPNDKTVNLNILIHTSNRGFNRMGHIDIYFDNKVISYGCYDEGSRYVGELFGDGVLFLAKSKKEYINFCIDNSKKTIFDFGIHLTDIEKKKVTLRIEELLKNTYPWNHKTDKNYRNGKSYAAKLYKRTSAKFYKFKSGKYKTYYVLGTNCCFLADDIIGKSGMDILSINGLITPGTYYDYLNRKLKGKNSNIIYKEIYNKDRRA